MHNYQASPLSHYQHLYLDSAYDLLSGGEVVGDAAGQGGRLGLVESRNQILGGRPEGGREGFWGEGGLLLDPGSRGDY